MKRSNTKTKTSSERIAITLKTGNRTGEDKDVELPLKMLVIGNFLGDNGQSTNPPNEDSNPPLAERAPVNIDKTRFNTVMNDVAPRLKTTLTGSSFSTIKSDPANDKKTSELKLDLCFRSIADFHPDNIIRQVPSLDRLYRLRELLIDLKRYPDKSQQILTQITDLAMS